MLYEVITLNRQKLPEVQNERAKKMGVEFDFEINLTGLIYDGQQVIGVEGINNKTKQPYKKTAKIVVDATGVTSMLRNTFVITSYSIHYTKLYDADITAAPPTPLASR